MSKKASKKAVKKRSPGRPAGGGMGLSRERILGQAAKLLDDRGLKAFSMRELARALKADPMAVYHYFGGRDALLTELGAVHFRRFEFRIGKRAGWRTTAAALGRAYLEHVEPRLELLLFLTHTPGAAAEPARIMAEHFARVTAPLNLRPADAETAMGVFFDFLHGYALGLRGGAGMGAAFKRELEMVLNGIEASAPTR